jgi:two-component sensor histidine kinase
MNHRVKNLFAIVSGMIGITARSARTPQEMAQSLLGRLNALAQANDLVKPGIMGSEKINGERTTMEALVRTVLLPYATGKDGSDRILLSGPEVTVGANAVTSLALVLHESATNAAKYGALSQPDGTLRIKWNILGDDFRFKWEETGGPAIAGPPTSRGFGSILAERSIAGQLGGIIAYDWQPAGLRLKVEIPMERLAS